MHLQQTHSLQFVNLESRRLMMRNTVQKYHNLFRLPKKILEQKPLLLLNKFLAMFEAQKYIQKCQVLNN